MAISQNTLIGSTKQSVGGVTFTKWKGRNIIKAKAVSVANPKTPAQVANRNRFSGVSKFYSRYKPSLSLAMLRMMGAITDGNIFASLNRLCFLTESVGVDLTRINELVLAKGSLGVFSEMSMGESSSGVAIVAGTYQPNQSQSSSTDKFRVLFFNVDADTFNFFDTNSSTSSVSVTFSDFAVAGQEVHSWIFSYSVTGKLLSDSVYCGSITAS